MIGGVAPLRPEWSGPHFSPFKFGGEGGEFLQEGLLGLFWASGTIVTAWQLSV